MASSTASSRSALSRHVPPTNSSAAIEDSVPVETLVQHLLDAKRSLSSMSLVLRANDVVHLAREAYEESVILTAQTKFLRHGISEQTRLLLRARKSMNRTYDTSKREFKQIIRTLDAANAHLEDTMAMLHNRTVESVFRPDGEQPRSLTHFIDESQVETLRHAVKDVLATLQSTQTSFDGDLLRFDTDLRSLNKALSGVPAALSPSASTSDRPLLPVLNSMMDHSHAMADLLTSLTKHFDLCVTAVRTTEGGAALARIKAAEATETQGGGRDCGASGSGEGGGVSISGVIAEQESEVDPISPEDRAQMLEVVVVDSSEVPDVVAEITGRLQSLEADFSIVDEQTSQIKTAYASALEAFHLLDDIGSRLQSYIAAESEFRNRWVEEHDTIQAKLVEMDELRAFYESYASSYDSLILEVERRKVLEDKVKNIWRKAQESVDKVVEGDRREREHFRQEVAEFLPTDLWPGMDDVMPRWEVVPAAATTSSDGVAALGSPRSAGGGTPGTPNLEKSVIAAAAARLSQPPAPR